MSRQVELSKRMLAVAKMVSMGNRVCDLGCDHGYVSIYLAQSGRSPHVLAMDVNRGPLQKAKEHVQKYAMEDYISLRLSDGLLAYRKGEADTLLAAGMGGRLLMQILSAEPEKTADFDELILQPQSEIAAFRRFLREKGYLIVQENMIAEDGKYYPIMKAKHQAAVSKDDPVVWDKLSGIEKTPEEQQREDLLGPLLLQERNPVLYQFICREKQRKETVLAQLAAAKPAEDEPMDNRRQTRKEELLAELALLNGAAGLWEGQEK